MGDRRAAPARQRRRRARDWARSPAALALTALYGLMRILMSLTQQGRDALFAAVAMNAVRRLAIEVFVHLHQLSLRFHLERKTGGLTRVLERGRNAIETIVRTSMLIAAPTVVEFALIVGGVPLFLRLALRRGDHASPWSSISSTPPSPPIGASASAAR